MGSWIQTQGKHYLANEWNIKKSPTRFQNIKLNENAPQKVSEKTYLSLNKILITFKTLKIKIY